MDDLFGELKAKAIQLLSRREHGERELLNKLLMSKQMGENAEENKEEVAAQVAAQVVEQLVECGYVSDLRFADMSLRNRALQGYGPLRIRQELKQKQVPGEIVQQVMDEAEIDWFANVIAMRERKFGLGAVEDLKLKAKQQRFLQYKGYGFDHIQYALEAKDRVFEE